MNSGVSAGGAASVLARVIEIIARTEQVERHGLGPQTRLEQDLGMDSLSRVELQMALEDEFGVQLADDRAESLCTIGDVADAVISVRGGSGLA